MRRVRLWLIVALCLVSVLFAATKIMQKGSGKDIPPEITCDSEVVDISVLQEETVLLNGVSASDEQDGDLTSRIMVGGISKLITDNSAKVTYLVFDSDGNMASHVRTVRYLDYRRPQISVVKPLIFPRDETMKIISCLRAEDVVDGDISDRIRLSTLRATDDSNVYAAVAQVTNSMGDTAKIELPILLMDTDPERPVIFLREYLTRVKQGEAYDPARYLRSVYVGLKSMPTDAVTWEGEVDTSVPGTYWVRYSCSFGGKTGIIVQTVVVEEVEVDNHES